MKVFCFPFLLLTGVFGRTIPAKIRVEIRTRDLGHLKKCQTGLEVHFKEPGNRKARSVSRGHFWCSKPKVLMGSSSPTAVELGSSSTDKYIKGIESSILNFQQSFV